MHVEYKIKLKILQLNCTNVVLNERWLFCKKEKSCFYYMTSYEFS